MGISVAGGTLYDRANAICQPVRQFAGNTQHGPLSALILPIFMCLSGLVRLSLPGTLWANLKTRRTARVVRPAALPQPPNRALRRWSASTAAAGGNKKLPVEQQTLGNRTEDETCTCPGRLQSGAPEALFAVQARPVRVEAYVS
jgi:hypothetical protein